MERDLFDSLQYTYQSTSTGVPTEWREDFGELNWLGPCCSRVKIGYGGKIYECIFTMEEPQPFCFGITETSIIIDDYANNSRIGTLGVRTIGSWENTRAPLLKTAILTFISEFLKEHKECYYK